MSTNYEAPKGYDEVQDGVRYSEIQVIEYPSKTTGTVRKANLLLPLDYTPEKKYPVLYLLHGIGGDHNEWLGGDPATVMSNLWAKGEAKEMIVVIPMSVPEPMMRAIRRISLPPIILRHLTTLSTT